MRKKTDLSTIMTPKNFECDLLAHRIEKRK